MCPVEQFLGLINLMFLLDLDYYYYVWFFNSAHILIFLQEYFTLVSGYGLRNQTKVTPVDSIKDVVRSLV